MTARDIEKEITELTQEGSAYWDKHTSTIKNQLMKF